MRIFQVTEAEGDKCEICRGRGKIDYHSEDGPSKCQKCNGKGVQAWKPAPVNWGNDKVKEDEVIQELTPGDRGVERNRKSAPVKPKTSNANMAPGKYVDMARARKAQALKAKQAAGNVAGSKVGGEISDFGGARAAATKMKNQIVVHPNRDDVHFQYIETGKGQSGWQWQEVSKTKTVPGQDHLREPNPGTYPIADKDSIAIELTSMAKGTYSDKSIADRVKDKAVAAMGGELANKTMQDPGASTAAKIGGVAGAALGRLASKAIKRPTVAVAKPDLPTQGNHMNDINMHQKGMVDQSKEAGERIKHAQEFLNVLKKHDVKYDVDKYVQAITPAIKRSGLQKAAPEFYGQFVKQVRAMRTEAYEYANELLEAAGLTWEQVGYTVSLHEGASDVVFLTPITALTELTEQIQLQDLKKLAGMQ